MTDPTHRTVRREDYLPPAYLVDSIALRVVIEEPACTVEARLEIRRNPAAPDADDVLVLDGHELELDHIAIDGEPLAPERYRVDERSLTVSGIGESFTLETRTRVDPWHNTALEGLYASSGNLCTQCEAEGFRRITWYPDRPDVLARFTTEIVADRERYPVLLSNGNPVAAGALEGGRHWVRWEDPHPKPSYLFALVAGRLVCVEDRFVTAGGREVALRFYVQEHNRDRCAHALASLARAMRWDEERYGREYDLDIYMVVAVDDFNMGAMENKGLNVFNSRYVLARDDTATDGDFAAIENVIAHEYFHNWTGNRVTCRDWFQLSLKEGLTVFRDQQFSAEMGSGPVKRIEDVRVLRNHQFAEDAGPLAHPVRPDSYIEISNFYTVTVYNKGAEVVRMIHTLLGTDGFRAGMDRYFERHDGAAVTCDDFVAAMEDANGADLEQFRRWYSQAGTPVVTARVSHDADARRAVLELDQRCPPTPGQPEKRPFLIPLRVAMLDADGEPIPLRLAGEDPAAAATERVLELREPSERFEFTDVERPPVPSLNRGFSAPIAVETERDDATLAFLLAHDGDPFNRWDAAQEYATRLILRGVERIHAGEPVAVDALWLDAMTRLLQDRSAEPALTAEALTLPAEGWIAERSAVADPEAIHRARRALLVALAGAAAEAFRTRRAECRDNAPYRYEAAAAGRRRLDNLCLGYLMETDDRAVREECLARLEHADNMTDAAAALVMLANCEHEERAAGLASFEARWRDDPLVLDKWFTAQATSRLDGTLERVRALMEHPRFDLRNPNRVRAVIGAFAHGNPRHFHARDGSGYDFVAAQAGALDRLNPQIAARLISAFGRWSRYDEPRRRAMRGALEKLAAQPGLSRDSYEVVTKTLG